MSTTPPNPLTTPAPAAPATPAPNPNTQSVTTPSADGISVDELAGSIKSAHPEYKDVDNHELVSSVVSKYPVYQTHLSTGGLQDLLKHENQFNMDKFLASDQRKQIDKMAEQTVMGSAGASGMMSGLKLAMEKGAGTVGTKIIEHELTDSAGNPLVTNVERGVLGQAREAAMSAYNYARANKVKTATALYLAGKLGVEGSKVLHILQLVGD